MRDYTRHTEETQHTEETTVTALSPEPPTDFEYKQAHRAWRQLIGSTNGQTIGLRWRVRELTRTAFIFGWAACARSGIGSPALADVPIPPESVLSFFTELKIELGTRPTPRLGQEVRYHGSVDRFQGAYFWIMGITETADSEGQAQALYVLGRWTGRGYRRVLSDVHRSSITPLDNFHEVKWIR
ncbi:hypothetical protein [Streptomyces melanosporofaciens]|uniref:Uncharacterized protein n=1 Tax=Streptomyces melanosporofaciens TaxID=67327 RepID=A0A1H4ID71_STRMJ|nr:hypothetical protein [Streptomyces melanosporofaciens]SEB31855.1 hypothetical protein SAMN04490356_0524 [Streptomyces melanosporofaciens]